MPRPVRPVRLPLTNHPENMAKLVAVIADPRIPDWYGLEDDLVATVLAATPFRPMVRLSGLSRQMRRVCARALEAALKLSPEQAAAFLDVMRGHNVFLTGGAGVGKSHTLMVIREYLRSSGTVVTASTGCAAAIVGAQTLHSAIGIGIGTSSHQSYVFQILKQKPWIKARLQNLRTLVVDEAGMLDGALFDKAGLVVGNVRRDHNGDGGALARSHAPTEPFHGVQVVVCGDFLQLPPVNQSKSGWIYESKAWAALELRNHVLTMVHRQGSDVAFAKLLNRMRLGEGTPADLSHLVENSAQGAPPGDALRLFARNKPADDLNKERFEALVGYKQVSSDLGEGWSFTQVPTKFDAIDTFPHSPKPLPDLLANCPAPKTLWLAVGARVMCLKNIETVNGRLVNGSLGVVKTFAPERDNPTNRIVGMTTVVTFDAVLGAPAFEYMFRTHVPSVAPTTENTFSVTEGRQIKAQRIQIPLRLAWAVRSPPQCR